MSEIRVTVTEDGPYKVEGTCTVIAPDGSPVETREGKPIWLCRCGGSGNKPFCDGTHRHIGFTDPEPATESG